ncbi:hypothetical protein B0H21DRAFT_866326 [Amylocystis lapponica]|nr:hypothetical protein B0H21DRAFT_866326 [Amylocystis lapponica]
MASHWPWLPIEVYIHILSLIAPTRDHQDTTLKTLLSCLCANSHLRAAALAPFLWEALYRTRYTQCIEEKEHARREAARGDWHALYVARRVLDRRALQLVDAIRADVGGAARHSRARVLAQELAFDVWDALELEAQLPLPLYFRTEGAVDLDLDEPVPHALPRRYWARAAMGVIARYYTMVLWRSMAAGAEVGFEEALAGLSAFFDESPKKASFFGSLTWTAVARADCAVSQITARLGHLAAQCRQSLLDAGVELERDRPNYDLGELCVRIRDYLHSIGYGSASADSHWYNILIQFPHAFLSEGPYRKTLPMSLVYVFVAVARRLGIQASPTNFPGKVLCHIAAADPAAPDMLFDMCSDNPPHVFSSKDPVRMRADVGLPPNAPDDYVLPCSAATALHRAGGNIVMAVRWIHRRAPAVRVVPEIPTWASYAASCVFLFHTPDLRLLARVAEWKPLDAVAVVQDGICPALASAMQTALAGICARQLETEELGGAVWPRAGAGAVRFFVGLVVEHVDAGFVGCVRGWHPRCRSRQDVSAIMAQEGFVRGWEQPFYLVVTADGRDTYLPEEKLRPAPFTRGAVREMFDNLTLFARYFEGVQVGAVRGRVLMSQELKYLYPDDDAVGAAWAAQGGLE